MHRRGFVAALGGALLPTLTSGVMADEKQAVEAIEKLGGKVTRDSKRAGEPVTDVDLAHSKSLKDDDLKILKEFKQLEWLSLNQTAVTDAGLAYVKDLKNLKTLGLLKTGVTDKGLVHLKGLKKLGAVNLIGTKVTKKGAAGLQRSLPEAMILEEP